ncbi:hypothetical protein [Williamsia serinedens]|uniref:Uncharacterized protein n=1 Tax=Williamsia serinedens TaxID=391736 RepID=A0ABT1H624_9NOCA|nr:hypothetical protein [Williamsia serinedens]MCP2162689.1 hypothetical protein [Williamsia serinedens]
MSTFQTVHELAEEWGAGFTPRYIRSQLQEGGVFHGLGHKKGQEWRFTEDDKRRMVERLHVPARDLDAPAPSGLSPRSRLRRTA